MLNLVGSTSIGGREFKETDSIGAMSAKELAPDNFYGGRVKSFLKTTEGFLLCRDKRDNIFDIAYDEDTLSHAGKIRLGLVKIITEPLIVTKPIELAKPTQKPIEDMNINELREYGRSIGLIFKVGVTKEHIFNAIQEKEVE